MNDKPYFDAEGITQSDRVLHTPGTFAKEHLTYVQEAGTLTSLKPHWCKRDHVDSFLFMYVLDGNGILRADQGHEYRIKKGDCAFVDGKEGFEHCSSKESPWKLMWVHFNGQEVQAYYEYFRQVNKSPVFHIASTEGRDMKTLLENIIEVQSKKDIYGEFQSALYLKELLTYIVMDMKKKEQKASQEFFEAIRAYIADNYTNDNLIHEIEDKFSYAGFDIQKEFEKRYGLSLWDYILNRKFTVAKELLRFSIKPVDEIVQESGIRNTDLFYQLFKQNENMTPEEYRRNWAQWIKA